MSLQLFTGILLMNILPVEHKSLGDLSVVRYGD